MSDPVIKVQNISKQYRLGKVGTGSLAHDINRLWHRTLGKEDPYLKLGEENNREIKGNSNYVWALKDINFDIQQGDRVGIIGRNGAGKSTLLKILSRTTSPTTGSVKIKGKVASLLEVGTGFHPELSGKENIFLNGAILGMSKLEIKSRYDEIVDFAGVEKYIDTPVKRYSSGMYVRLAFAVAANLNSDILIVDEVLAVGDAEFQKKCLGKMNEVSKQQGRTVLFVSHNMASVQRLCEKGILLVNGELLNNDKIDLICNQYISLTNKDLKSYFSSDESGLLGDAYVNLREIRIVDSTLNDIKTIYITTAFRIVIEYEIKNNLYQPDLSFLISTVNEEKVLHVVHETGDYSIGLHKWIVSIPPNLLNSLNYIFTLGITTSHPVRIHLKKSISFEVHEDYESATRNSRYIGKMHGVIRPHFKWQKL